MMLPAESFAPYGAAHVTLTMPTGRTQSFVWSGLVAMDVAGAIRRALPVAYPGATLDAFTVLALPDPVALEAQRAPAAPVASPLTAPAPVPRVLGEALVTVERHGRTETFPWGGIAQDDVEAAVRAAIAQTMPEATVISLQVTRQREGVTPARRPGLSR